MCSGLLHCVYVLSFAILNLYLRTTTKHSGIVDGQLLLLWLPPIVDNWAMLITTLLMDIVDVSEMIYVNDMVIFNFDCFGSSTGYY